MKPSHFLSKGLALGGLLFLLLVLAACQQTADDTPAPTVTDTAEADQATPTLAPPTEPPPVESTPTLMPEEPTDPSPTATAVDTATPEPTLPEATRISFAPDAYTATVEGALAPPESDSYVLRALAGQNMSVSVLSPGNNVVLGVEGVDDGQAYQSTTDGQSGWFAVLPATQDYLLTVEPAGGETTYSLQVTIAFPATDTPPIRVQFEPGAISATLEGHVQPWARIPYVFAAEGGQRMRIDISSADGMTNFSLVGLTDGQPYKRIEFPETVWEGIAPQSQDYEIGVQSLSGGDYTLEIAIEPLGEVPVIINDGSPPPEQCVAVHPGGVAPAVDVRIGPDQQLAVIAHLGNWAVVLNSLEGWYVIEVDPTTVGYVTEGSVELVGPCDGTPSP